MVKNSLISEFSELFLVVCVCICVWILIQINHVIFQRIRKTRKGIEVIFFERVLSVLIAFVGSIIILSSFVEIKSVWRTILGGTALASAVLAFAAQDVLKDVMGGLMISIYKPFEIGNRIELEDGQAGIVIDITMRHVVIRLLDTQVEIIPNSRLNTMKLKNYSYHSPYRAKEFTFNISYDSDVEKARRLVQQAVIESKYTVPGKEKLNGMEYGPVYFMAFEDSSLKLMTTVYFPENVPPEVMTNDINYRVNEGFKKYGIEIPYAFVNVVERPWVDSGEPEEGENLEEFRRNVPGLPLMAVSSKGKGMKEAVDATAKLGEDCGLNRKDVLRLRLLSEELFGMMRNLVGEVEGSYWVWQDKRNFAIHLKASVSMNLDLRRKFLSVSSSGRNEAAQGFMGKVKELIDVMTLPADASGDVWNPGIMGMGFYGGGIGEAGIKSYTWSMLKYKSEIENNKNVNSEADEAWDELEKSIVANIADEVRISMDGSTVEVKIYKKF